MKRDLGVRKETYIYETKKQDVRARWWAAATSAGSAARANYMYETKRDQQIRKETCTYEKRPEGSLMSSGDVCRICSTRELHVWNKKRPTYMKRDLSARWWCECSNPPFKDFKERCEYCNPLFRVWNGTWGLADDVSALILLLRTFRKDVSALILFLRYETGPEGSLMMWVL